MFHELFAGCMGIVERPLWLILARRGINNNMGVCTFCVKRAVSKRLTAKNFGVCLKILLVVKAGGPRIGKTLWEPAYVCLKILFF
jgi:hypothetical protein